jgi:hypothetical protein
MSTSIKCLVTLKQTYPEVLEFVSDNQNILSKFINENYNIKEVNTLYHKTKNVMYDNLAFAKLSSFLANCKKGNETEAKKYFDGDIFLLDENLTKLTSFKDIFNYCCTHEVNLYENVALAWLVGSARTGMYYRYPMVWVQAQVLKSKIGKARYYRARQIAKLGLN